MHIIKNLQSFLLDQEYYIDLYNNNIHVYHFIDIKTLTSDFIELEMEGFLLQISGSSMVVKRLEPKEILIEGTITDVRLQR